MNFDFKPLVCDVYGGWGERALKVWSKCAALHVERQRFFLTVADFNWFYGKLLSISVVKAHAYALEGYSQKVRNTRMTTTTGPRLVESVEDAPSNPFYS